jgi:hypothetical protein
MNQPTKSINVQGVMKVMEDVVAKSPTGCTFVRLKTCTSPKFSKTGRVSKMPLNIPAENIKKISEFSVGLGYDYQKSVENKLVKEGKSKDSYVRKETWHKPLGDSKVFHQHKETGEVYIYATLNANNNKLVKYVNVVTGDEIPEKDLEEFLPVESAPKNQGLEEGNEVRVMTLKLSSLKGLSACNESYEVV